MSRQDGPNLEQQNISTEAHVFNMEKKMPINDLELNRNLISKVEQKPETTPRDERHARLMERKMEWKKN